MPCARGRACVMQVVVTDDVFLSQVMSWVRAWENNNKKRQVGVALLRVLPRRLIPQVFLPHREPKHSSLCDCGCWQWVQLPSHGLMSVRLCYHGTAARHHSCLHFPIPVYHSNLSYVPRAQAESLAYLLTCNTILRQRLVFLYCRSSN